MLERFNRFVTENLTKNLDVITKTFYLLSTDCPLMLPAGQPIVLGITSADVLHSFAVPSFGIKMDACPGRLNTIYFTIARSG